MIDPNFLIAVLYNKFVYYFATILLLKHAKAIRESLYEHLRHLDNQANNLYSVWISMVILLYRIGIEELFKFISLTFAIQVGLNRIP